MVNKCEVSASLSEHTTALCFCHVSVDDGVTWKPYRKVQMWLWIISTRVGVWSLLEPITAASPSNLTIRPTLEITLKLDCYFGKWFETCILSCLEDCLCVCACVRACKVRSINCECPDWNSLTHRVKPWRSEECVCCWECWCWWTVLFRSASRGENQWKKVEHPYMNSLCNFSLTKFVIIVYIMVTCSLFSTQTSRVTVTSEFLWFLLLETEKQKDTAIEQLQKQINDIVHELNVLKEQQALQTGISPPFIKQLFVFK